MDTGLRRDGYSLVGQGGFRDPVGQGEDRRQVLERRPASPNTATAKASRSASCFLTEENLVRTRDIILELEQRIGPLSEQAAKARTYLDLRGE